MQVLAAFMNAEPGRQTGDHVAVKVRLQVGRSALGTSARLNASPGRRENYAVDNRRAVGAFERLLPTTNRLLNAASGIGSHCDQLARAKRRLMSHLRLRRNERSLGKVSAGAFVDEPAHASARSI